MLVANFADLSDRLYSTDLVVSCHYCNKAGIITFLTQCIVFVVSSIILLLLTRPVVKKLQNNPVATNYELDVGKTAIVIEPIDNSVNKGRVTLEGTDWAARTEDGSKISEGTPVKVVRIDGAKLIVSEEK